jgi:hypothetical protein
VITSIHAILYSKHADEVRAFLNDVLALPSVDAGEGWPIFAAPPTELAVHPSDDEAMSAELYLMCDDVTKTVADLAARGITTTMPVADRGWGLVTELRLPGGDTIGLYEPRHPSPPR